MVSLKFLWISINQNLIKTDGEMENARGYGEGKGVERNPLLSWQRDPYHSFASHDKFES